MTFEDKTEVVISQLRADRDRLQNAIDNIRAEIEAKKSEGIWWTWALETALDIIEKHTGGDTKSHCDDCVLLKICEKKNDPSCTFREKYNPQSVLEDILAENEVMQMNDVLIGRQVVIDLIKKHNLSYGDIFITDQEEFMKYLNALPSISEYEIVKLVNSQPSVSTVSDLIKDIKEWINKADEMGYQVTYDDLFQFLDKWGDAGK